LGHPDLAEDIEAVAAGWLGTRNAEEDNLWMTHGGATTLCLRGKAGEGVTDGERRRRGERDEAARVVERRRGWWSGGAGGGVDGEEPCVAKAPSREEKTGRRRHESGGGEGTTRGKWEVRVAATWVRGLPNDERIQPGAKNDVGMRPGENGWIPRGYWAPKGALRAGAVSA
jgi:hypothetical protein